MSINITPTLGSTFIETKPARRLTYMMRYYCSSPKSVDGLYSDLIPSLAKTIQTSGHDPSLLKRRISNEIKEEMNALFKVDGSSAECVVDTKIYDNGNYDVTISPLLTIGHYQATVTTVLGVRDGQITSINEFVENDNGDLRYV